MIQFHIEAVIFYQHESDEVEELNQAIKPMAEHIKAVASDHERKRLRKILGCHYFRRRDVATVKSMLLRAAKHARGHLSEYFPYLQQAVVAQAEELEDAVDRYVKRFKSLQAEVIPVN